MAKPAIAVIIAGSGEVSDNEVTDLLDDYLSGDNYDDVGLIVPTGKALFTKSVEQIVDWYNDDKNVYPVQAKGEGMTRRAAKLGDDTPQQVESFADVFADDFDGFDEVVFVVALPEEDEEDYDTYVALVEAALDANVSVKNLCRGLDDVLISDEPEPEAAAEPEPEPEPESEPEKPTRRRRKAEPEPEDVPVSGGDDEPEPEVKAPRKSRAKKEPEPENEAEQEAEQEAVKPPSLVQNALEQALAYFMAYDTAVAIASGQQDYSSGIRKTLEEALGSLPAPGEPTIKPVEPEVQEAPSRGRGRPRTNFTEKQMEDEDGNWVPRGRGRVAKGTRIRTFNTSTEEVTEEGIA